MNSNSKFCQIYDCDYDNYYLLQACGNNDSNEISFYTGKPYQRGYNFFARLGKKFAIPLLKFFGKKAFNYGKNVTSDILRGDDIKSSLKSNLKRSASETLDDIKNRINQTGKRRRIKKISPKTKKKMKYKTRNKKKTLIKTIHSIKKVKRRKSPKKSVKRKTTKRKPKRYKNIFD